MHKKISNNRKAFTLAEIMIALLVVILLAAFSAPIITKQLKRNNKSTPHGRYECYKVGTQYYQKTSTGNIEGTAQAVASCNFNSVINKSAYYVLQAIGGGGGGSTASNGYGGAAGDFNSLFLPQIENTLYMTVGGGGAKGNPPAKGGTTYVQAKDSSGVKTTILSSDGGIGGIAQDIQSGTDNGTGTGDGNGTGAGCHVNTSTGYCDYNDYGPLYFPFLYNVCDYYNGTLSSCDNPGLYAHVIYHEAGATQELIQIDPYSYDPLHMSTYLIKDYDGTNTVQSFIKSPYYSTLSLFDASTYQYVGTISSGSSSTKIYIKLFPSYQLVESKYPLTCQTKIQSGSSGPGVGYNNSTDNSYYYGVPVGLTTDGSQYSILNCNTSYSVTSLSKVQGYDNLYATGVDGDIVKNSVRSDCSAFRKGSSS